MKKLISILLSIIITIALTACNEKIFKENDEANTDTNPTTTTTLKTEVEIPQELNIDEIKKYLNDNYDKFNIDGSTSMMPLHQSLNDLFGTGEKALHSRTVDAFDKFILGENDILLGVDYSDELLEEAKSNGIELVKKEITREAFVFLIKKNNSVQNLTTEQIKDIYSGKITNWSEVGGDDAPINAFQRNADSGSQIRMNKFMGDIKLMENDVTYYQGMGDIIEAIANYDKGKYSIAYNMYTFTEKQYKHDEVILLSVNGIKPNEETIFNESYPIVIYNYIYYNKNNAQASEFAENLHAYLMTDEGQKLISDSGYVNLNTNYDRNKNIASPYDYDLNGEKYVNFYNKAKGEFYELNENNELLTFYNYADYVLRDSKYKDNEKARDFLTSIFNSNIPLHQFTTVLNEEAGKITLRPWFDGVFDPEDFFNCKYGGKYYSYFEYLINEDKYELIATESETFDSYAEYLKPLSGYINDCEPGSTVEITKDELKNLYFRVNKYIATVDGVTVNEYNFGQEGLKFELEYYKPFE